MNPPALLDSLILTIRGQKVLLDADLTAIYGVATKRLNEQVKRNAERFPEDFVFQLTDEEKCQVVANCDHLPRLKFSKSRPLPMPSPCPPELRGGIPSGWLTVLGAKRRF